MGPSFWCRTWDALQKPWRIVGIQSLMGAPLLCDDLSACQGSSQERNWVHSL
jgi:hypothetical protein